MSKKKDKHNSDKNDKKFSDTFITIMSGSISGIIVTFAKQPIARIKWLKQVPSVGSTAAKDNIIKLGINIAKTEGVTGLWRGSITTILRNIPHSILIYTLYPKYYNALNRHNIRIIKSKDKNSFLIKTFAGSLTSFTATIITHPLDTLRVRTAVQYNEIVYTNVFSSFKKIFKDETPKSFYKGLSTTLLGTIFRGGIGFSLFETFKHAKMVTKNPETQQNAGLIYFWKLVVGLGAGTISTIATYPIDTVRRKQQVFGANRNDIDDYKQLSKNIGGDRVGGKNAWFITKHLYKVGGIRIFYKGMALGLVKTPFAVSVSLTVNDLVKDLFGWKD